MPPSVVNDLAQNCSVRFGYDHIVQNVDVDDNIIRQDRSLSLTNDVAAAGLVQDRGDTTRC